MNKKIVLVDRQKAIDICYHSGKNFLEHFDKIYQNPSCSIVSQYIVEMQNLYNQVREIGLEEDGMTLPKDYLVDWFFTAGSYPEKFIPNMTREELDAYNDFTYRVLLSGDIKNSLTDIVKDLQ